LDIGGTMSKIFLPGTKVCYKSRWKDIWYGTGEIKDDENGSYLIRFENDFDIVKHDELLKKFYIIEEGKPKSEPKFQLGDMVWVKHNSRFVKGEIVKIQYLLNNKYTYCVRYHFYDYYEVYVCGYDLVVFMREKEIQDREIEIQKLKQKLENKEKEQNIMKEKFTKDDLKTGMLVRVKSGEYFVVVKGHKNGDLLENEDKVRNLNEWDNGLKHNCDANLNIEKVYNSEESLMTRGWKVFCELSKGVVWSREKEKVEVSMNEAMDILAEKMNCNPEDLKIVG